MNLYDIWALLLSARFPAAAALFTVTAPALTSPPGTTHALDKRGGAGNEDGGGMEGGGVWLHVLEPQVSTECAVLLQREVGTVAMLAGIRRRNKVPIVSSSSSKNIAVVRAY
jgi:hypothetical protein